MDLGGTPWGSWGAEGERLQRCCVCSVCMLGMFHAQALWGSTQVGKGMLVLLSCRGPGSQGAAQSHWRESSGGYKHHCVTVGYVHVVTQLSSWKLWFHFPSPSAKQTHIHMTCKHLFLLQNKTQKIQDLPENGNGEPSCHLTVFPLQQWVLFLYG